MKTAVLINLSSNNGNALKRWNLIEKEIKEILPPDTIYIHYYPPFEMKKTLQQLINRHQINYFVSAGGDGSLNFLVNSLGELINYNFNNFCLGAIGLGSSNDFLKPVKKHIKGVPVKLDVPDAVLSDIGVVTYFNNGNREKRLFCINSSIGFTAEGNKSFNTNKGLTGFIKARSTNLAIILTVIKTFFLYKNLSLKIKIKDSTKEINVTNLSVAKNPNVSGNFRYDLSTYPDSGKIGLYIAEDLSKVETLKLLYNLTRNRFSTLKKCSALFVEEVEIESVNDLHLEADGEITSGNHFRFSVLPKSLLIAS